MPVPRIAVIGHVEWNAFASADRPLQAGGIYHFEDTVEDVGGGGGVSARVLPGLGRRKRLQGEGLGRVTVHQQPCVGVVLRDIQEVLRGYGPLELRGQEFGIVGT